MDMLTVIDINAVRGWASGIGVALCTAAVLAAMIPLARNFGASFKIWLSNHTKDKPTFTVGTRFSWVGLPSGLTIEDCEIMKVTFWSVTLVENETGCVVTLPKVIFGPMPKAVMGQYDAIKNKDNR